MRVGERLGFYALLLTVLVAAAVASLSMPPAAKYLPLCVAVGGAVVACWCCVVDLRKSSGKGHAPIRAQATGASGTETALSDTGDEPGPEEGQAGWFGPVGTFAWLTAFVAAIWLFGYLIVTPVFALGYLLLARVRWQVAVCVSLGLLLAAYLLLGVVLNY